MRGLRRIPGLAKLSIAVYKFTGPRGVQLVEAGGHRLYVDLSNAIIGSVYAVGGNWEAEEKEFFKARLRTGMTVVDIGANIGDYTLVASRGVGDSGMVYAFEPDPVSYSLLERNIRLNNCENVVPYNLAITDSVGERTLYLDSEDSGRQSLSAANVREVAECVRSRTETLDHFFENLATKPDFIKIDAQGAEGLILQGAQNLLRKQDLQVIMEFWPRALRNFGVDPMELLRMLESNKFKLGIIRGSGCATATLAEILRGCESGPDRSVDLFCSRL